MSIENSRCPYRLIPGAACVAESEPGHGPREGESKPFHEASSPVNSNAKKYNLRPCGNCGETNLLNLNPRSGRIFCYRCGTVVEIDGGREAVVDQLVANAVASAWNDGSRWPRDKTSVAR